jgi:hypothetical protein
MDKHETVTEDLVRKHRREAIRAAWRELARNPKKYHESAKVLYVLDEDSEVNDGQPEGMDLDDLWKAFYDAMTVTGCKAVLSLIVEHLDPLAVWNLFCDLCDAAAR